MIDSLKLEIQHAHRLRPLGVPPYSKCRTTSKRGIGVESTTVKLTTTKAVAAVVT